MENTSDAETDPDPRFGVLTSKTEEILRKMSNGQLSGCCGEGEDEAEGSGPFVGLEELLQFTNQTHLLD